MADVMILFGSGGHSSEMLMLIQNARIANKLDLEGVNSLVCVISEDDKLIRDKIMQEFVGCKQKHKLKTVTLKRGRKVGQSYLTAIWTTFISIIHSINTVLTHKPKLCLTNGPAIGVTVSLAIRFLQIITLGSCYKCDLIYIESFCRTKTLSLSGRLIYHLRLADQFYVQWRELVFKYPRVMYKGILV